MAQAGKKSEFIRDLFYISELYVQFSNQLFRRVITFSSVLQEGMMGIFHERKKLESTQFEKIVESIQVLTQCGSIVKL